MIQFEIRQCTNPDCRFRFPLTVDPTTELSPQVRCPKCGVSTQPTTPPFSNYKEQLAEHQPCLVEVEALLDNVRSTYNVGSMFRTADGAGLRHLHLCGVTPTPDNPKIAKTALGAEGTVGWSYARNGLDVALSARTGGMRLWALESSPRAVLLFEALQGLPGAPVLLVVGNELSGVDPGILDICDQIVAIPMQGYKQSLNVAIAFGIAAYSLRFGQPVSYYNKSLRRRTDKIP